MTPDTDRWLLVKRGLYYRANDCGYTGIKDHAGIYSDGDARARLSPGITMVRFDDAPEFSEACFEDLARDHLQGKIERLRAALQEIIELHKSDLRHDEVADRARNIADRALEQSIK